ncbi:LuxR C-terminal-related transcriptional regulator [uncultured Sphingomonas sp.]|uniref:LuxR C-terminal-related transcriptional regulator n=1 Tax=uncultured Sphingomonas sp. TaxID=158754 RepID=UPI00157714B2
MVEDRAALLTNEQRSYLRLVDGGLTSKQIAQTNGGSHHTVNVRIAEAVRLLGVQTRAEAAAIVAAIDARGSYDRSYDPQTIVSTDRRSALSGAGNMPVRETGLPLPIATSGRPINTLNFWQRCVWILLLAASTALLVGGLVSGIIAQLDAVGRRF